MFYALMVIALLAADQISKLWAAQSLSAPIDVIPGFLAFTYAENRGAAFGIMPDMQPVFIIMSIVFAIIVSIYLTKRQHSLPVLARAGRLARGDRRDRQHDRSRAAGVCDRFYIRLWYKLPGVQSGRRVPYAGRDSRRDIPAVFLGARP